MTLTELRNAVRELVSDDITTSIDVVVWDYSHMPVETRPEVSVRIWVSELSDAVSARTASEAFSLFKAKLLPSLNRRPCWTALEVTQEDLG